MLLPISILCAAIAAAAVTAYGADPSWVLHPHGMELILLSRRLQWPLVGIALLGCAVLISMVVAGRWRAWWLIGLAAVLALFTHRFLTDPARGWQVDADATFTTADQSRFVHDNDYVVGLTFDGDFYAYPYSILYNYPVVAQARPRVRLLLIWSAFANRAVAAEADWTVKPRDLEIVSVPANSLLLYNTQIGEFINGVTGLTPAGRRPTGFSARVCTEKMTWKSWLQLHPQTFVLEPPEGAIPTGPTQPAAPRYPMPQTAGTTEVALIDTPHPAIIRESDVTTTPLNILIGSDPLLLFRDDTGAIRTFLRQANGDLTPRFYPISITGHPTIAFHELDSNTSWAADGRAVQGPLKGEKLQPYDVDDHVYLDVIRFWYPDLTLITPQPQDIGRPPLPIRAPPQRRSRSHLRRRTLVVTASS